MTLIDYQLQGAGGVTPSDGLAATLTNLGIPSGGSGLVSVSGGGSATFRTAAKLIQTYGVRVINASGQAGTIRFTPNAQSTTMARTTGLRLPALPTTTSLIPRVWTMTASSGTPLGLLWQLVGGVGHLFLQPVTGSNIDLGVFSAFQYVVIRAAIICNGTGASTLLFDLQTPGGGTISGTAQSSTTASLGTSPVIYGAAAASTGALAESYQVDVGYDRWDDGRTTLIPQLADTAPAVDSGTVSAVDDAGAFTAPTGTILANYADSDSATVVRSPVATSTLQSNTVSLQRMTPKAALVVNPGWARSPGSVGDGQIICSLLDGTTVLDTQTFNTTAGIPATVTFGSAAVAGATTDSGGAWANLKFRWGVKV